MSRRLRIVGAASAAGLGLVSLGTASLGSTPTAQTIDGSHPVAWSFGPAGGATASTDNHKLVVKLPAAAATYYAPDVAHGTTHAAVLSVIITYKPP